MTGSPRTIGRSYGEGVEWRLDGDVPAAVAELTVQANRTQSRRTSRLFQSAVGRSTRIGTQFATAGYYVCTNASPYRMMRDVPLLIRSQSRPFSPDRRAASQSRLGRIYHSQRQLFNDDGDAATQNLAERLWAGSRAHGDFAGDFRCRVSRSGVNGHSRQCRTVYRW